MYKTKKMCTANSHFVNLFTVLVHNKCNCYFICKITEAWISRSNGHIAAASPDLYVIFTLDVTTSLQL